MGKRFWIRGYIWRESGENAAFILLRQGWFYWRFPQDFSRRPEKFLVLGKGMRFMFIRSGSIFGEEFSEFSHFLWWKSDFICCFAVWLF